MGEEAAPLRVALAMAQLSDHSGGLAESVPMLARALRDAGADAAVLGVRDDRGAPGAGFRPDWVHVHEGWGPRVFGYARGWDATLDRLAPDVIDTQHLWMFPSLAALRAHRRRGTPLVITPRGMLDPWALRRGVWKKRLVRLWFEDAHLGRAACFRALNAREAQGIRAFGVRQPIFVVPNASPLPGGPVAAPDADPRVLLFLGRLDPKKGVRELIEAWGAVGARSGWRLQITGAGEPGYVAALRAAVPEAMLAGREVIFTGDQRGAEKRASYDRASAFILPSYSEGLPMSVLEAWSHGRPVLTTDAANLPEGFAAGAAIRVEATPGALAESLGALFAMEPDTLAEMGARARELVARRFSPEAMAQSMMRVYRWASGRGALPEDLLDGVA